MALCILKQQCDLCSNHSHPIDSLKPKPQSGIQVLWGWTSFNSSNTSLKMTLMVMPLACLDQWHLVFIVELYELQEMSNFGDDHSACDMAYEGGGRWPEEIAATLSGLLKEWDHFYSSITITFDKLYPPFQEVADVAGISQWQLDKSDPWHQGQMAPAPAGSPAGWRDFEPPSGQHPQVCAGLVYSCTTRPEQGLRLHAMLTYRIAGQASYQYEPQVWMLLWSTPAGKKQNQISTTKIYHL